MVQVLCSTGALLGRPNGRDFTLLEKYAPALECDGFEFMMYDSWYERRADLLRYMSGLGLNTPVMHCEKTLTEGFSVGDETTAKEALNRFENNVEIACGIGAKKLVLHLWNGKISDHNIRNNLRAYASLRSIADAAGIELLVENVVCAVSDPMTHWETLRKMYPDVKLIFDTKMAAFHSQEDLLYAPEYEWLWREGHIRHYHVNDYGGGVKDWTNLRVLPIGAGRVDFDRFFTFVKRTGYAGAFTLESTAFDREGNIDLSILNRQVSLVKHRMRAEADE